MERSDEVKISQVVCRRRGGELICEDGKKQIELSVEMQNL